MATKKYTKEIMAAIWAKGGTVKSIRTNNHIVIHTDLCVKPLVLSSTPYKGGKDQKQIEKYIDRHIKYNSK